jgi:hypothetical protein
VNAKPEQRAQAAALLEASPWLSDREIARRVGLGNKTVSRLRAERRVPRGTSTAESGAADGLPAVELAVAGGASERKLRRWHDVGLLAEPTR